VLFSNHIGIYHKTGKKTLTGVGGAAELMFPAAAVGMDLAVHTGGCMLWLGSWLCHAPP
jgi:uncharacterized membrane protein